MSNVAWRLATVKELVLRLALLRRRRSPEAQAAFEEATVAIVASRASADFEKD